METVIKSVELLLQRHGFKNFGFSDLNPTSFAYYEQWLSEGLNGDMAYLETHAPAKKYPGSYFTSAKSAIVITKSYVPHPFPIENSLPIASYAQGMDYHQWLKTSLNEVIAELQLQFPGESFLSFVDCAPVLERDFAVRAGLGWIGKNACLIDQDVGSFNFIGGILTSLLLTPQLAIAADRCGTCTRCIDACPTNAILPGKRIDAKACISYLTIESKTDPPAEFRDKIDSYFGCDICQMVCPWNRDVVQTKNFSSTEALEGHDLTKELQFILTASNKQIETRFAHTPLLRATPNSHRRNAIILAANKNQTDLMETIEKYRDHPRLKEISHWALTKLADPSQRLFQSTNGAPLPLESFEFPEASPRSL